jgi:hypothetical protein
MLRHPRLDLVATVEHADLEAFLDEVIAQAGVQTRAQESLRLADIRYRAGSDDLLTVLDAQRALFSAQDQLAQVQLSRRWVERSDGALDVRLQASGGCLVDGAHRPRTFVSTISMLSTWREGRPV